MCSLVMLKCILSFPTMEPCSFLSTADTTFIQILIFTQSHDKLLHTAAGMAKVKLCVIVAHDTVAYKACYSWKSRRACSQENFKITFFELFN